MTSSKKTLEQKFNDIKKEAKATYELFVDQFDSFEQHLDDEERDWAKAIENELHRIRKALRTTLTIKDKKNGTVTTKPRPTTKEYLAGINKRLDDVAADITELFSGIEFSESDE